MHTSFAAIDAALDRLITRKPVAMTSQFKNLQWIVASGLAIKIGRLHPGFHAHTVELKLHRNSPPTPGNLFNPPISVIARVSGLEIQTVVTDDTSLEIYDCMLTGKPVPEAGLRKFADLLTQLLGDSFLRSMNDA